MSSHSPISKQYQSSSESGDSLSDSFLDSEAALNATGNSGSKDFMANDYTLGLASPRSYISALDQDVSHYERRNDAAMRELFLATQPYTEEHGDLPKGDFIHSEIHSPSQFRAKSLISGESQYLSRPNHHTHHPLPHIVTENLDSAVDTSMLMASSAGYTLESNSATTGSSSGGSPRGDSENWTEDRNDKTQPASRTRKTRREKPRIQLAPDQPPTTQGKPRSRVYVACVQWCASSWSKAYPTCADSSLVAEPEKFDAMVRNPHVTIVAVERLVVVAPARTTQLLNVGVRTKHLAHGNELPGMVARRRIAKSDQFVDDAGDETRLVQGPLLETRAGSAVNHTRRRAPSTLCLLFRRCLSHPFPLFLK